MKRCFLCAQSFLSGQNFAAFSFTVPNSEGLISTKRGFLVLIFSYLLFSANASTYFVSKTGSDSNNGSQSAPFLTVTKSIGAATSPGDIVNIGAGAYNEAVTLNHAGTSGSPITFQGVSTNAIITGNQVNISADYVILSTVTIAATNYVPYSEVNINNNFDTITNCLFPFYGVPSPSPTWAANQTTIIIFYGHDDLVKNSVIQNIYDVDAFHIWGYNNTLDGVTVTNLEEANYADNHTDFVQNWSWGAAAVSTNILIKNCLIEDSTCQSANLESDGNANINNWRFENDVWANVQNPVFTSMPETIFLNCVFYKTAENSSSGDNSISFYPGSSGNEIINCVFLEDGSNPANTGYGTIGSTGPSLNTMLIDHNYFGGMSYAAKSTSAGAYLGTNPVNGGNPKFLNETGYDFHLLTNSVLIGAGTNLFATFTSDRVGNTRSSSGAWDIGAYAYTTNSSGAIPPVPLGLQIQYPIP